MEIKMNFLTFVTNKNERKSGIVNTNNRAVPFAAINSLPELADVNDVYAFIKKYGTELPEGIMEGADKAKESYGLSEIRFLAPIPEVHRNVICLGKNYAKHIAEMRKGLADMKGLPEHPIYFSKFANPAAAHGDTVRVTSETTSQVDYEAELGLVIGKVCKNVKRDSALDYIFGYTIINDFSARDLQNRHIQWFKGKNLDGFCPIGPWITHYSYINDPAKLDIKCRINGETRQNSNTSNMIFDIPFIIEDLSKAMTLYPGDIISTGTPEGVGMGFNPPRFLNNGDIVECEIDKIGVLRNYFEIR
jgi:2-keto-4-pentenoate hydratase/2-oxohepta-3-ene-1,7-dioic acid hydratase (catechol pathway)